MKIEKMDILKKENGKYIWEGKYMWILCRRKEIAKYITYKHEIYAKRMMKYSDKLLA